MTKRNDKNGALSGVVSAGMILRPALIKGMREKSTKKNIFITAPAGYGKTVAATLLLASARGATARLMVGHADDNPGVFYRRLAIVLLGLVGNVKRLQGLPATGLSLDGLLEILRLLPQKNARCYLAVDDLHMLKGGELLSSLPLIVNRLPGYVCLCLVSRAEPSESFLETGRFEVFTKEDLLFTPEEIESLCLEKDCFFTSERIKDLREMTGGWAMHLSALLSGEKEPETELKSDAPRQTLFEYLDTRVWGLWDDETKDLLLRLAVPVEITPELCERLTGQTDGRSVLERLIKKENAFLSRIEDDTYRFHDLFRDFLMERIDGIGEDEIRRLNDITAGWHYERGEYFSGARHYIENRDHEGVSRCMRATNRYHEQSGSLSVETSLSFTRQYIMNLSPDFVAENPYLLSECAVVAYHSGDAGEFLRYTDMLYQRLPEIAAEYPDLAESVGFIGSLDFRAPLKEYARQVVEMMPLMPDNTEEDEAHSNTITQNLPFFHRSMRDFSEYHDLREDELKLLRDTFGVMIGRDYTVMEPSLIAGICYERGELLEAARHALNGYHAIADWMQPETVFSAHMILAAALYAMGAAHEANRIMERAEAYVESKAQFLRPNFRALQTERAIRAGDTEAAKEWLAVFAKRTERLPFYQMCRHFATLRSHIAVGDYGAAIKFGKRLQTLAAEYSRPLDQIESGLLTAIALWHIGEKNKAVRLVGEAVDVATPYGFTQLFVNEGMEILPLLWALRERTGKTVAFMRFVDRLADEIYEQNDFGPAKERPPHLSTQQRAMLSYLSKGMSYNEIADATGIERVTVKTHILLVYKRLGVHNKQEAVVKAKILGLLEQSDGAK